MAQLSLSGRRIDLASRRITDGQNIVRLTTREAQLLALLVDRAGETLAKDDVVRAMWGHASDSAFYTTVQRLRNKIETDPAEPTHLLTVHGVGLKLVGACTDSPEALPPSALDVPGPRTSILGRGADLLAVRAAWDGGARLVTLGGPGGVGKTRLAQEVARTAGVATVWLDLVLVRSLEGLVAAVANALDVPILGDDPVSSLGRLAGSRGLLWVLDNAEHLVDELAPCLDRWLDLAPKVRWLVTSRTAVRVVGEQWIDLAPLDPQSALDLLRARANATVADGVGDALVRRLDGLPLALELVAPQLSVFSAATVLARLQDAPELVASDRRSARHASLDAVIAWSWELLGPDEQEVLRQLWGFVQPFDGEDVLAVAGPGAAGSLQRLRAASMLQAVDGDERRFRLLESVRAFARRKTPEVARNAVRLRIAERIVARTEPHRRGAWEGVAALDAIAGWAPSLFGALEAAQATGEADLAFRIVRVLSPYLASRGPQRRLRTAAQAALAIPGGTPRLRACTLVTLAIGRRDDTSRRQLEQAVALLETDPDPVTMVQALSALARIQGQDDHALADATHARALELAKRDPTRQAEAHALRVWGSAVKQRGEPARAEALLHEALAVSRLSESPFDQRASLMSLAHLICEQADPERAVAYIEEVRRLGERLGNPLTEAHALNQLGIVYVRLLRVDEGLAAMREALDQVLELGDQLDATRILGNIASTCLTAGRVDEAIRTVEQALAFAREHDDLRSQGVQLFLLATCYQTTGRTREARAFYGEARDLCERSDNQRFVGNIEANLAGLALAEGRFEDARGHLERALTIHRQVGNPSMEANALRIAARIALAAGDLVEAAAGANAAVLRAAEVKYVRGELRARSVLGTVLAQQGRVVEAREVLGVADSMLRHRSDPGSAALVRIGWLHAGLASGDVEPARAGLPDSAGDLQLDGGPSWSSEVRAALDELARVAG